MNTRTSVRLFLAAAIGALSLSAFAGERVEGNGITKEAAAQAAERRAMALARDKNTCEITRSKLSECKRESDGTWTCYASADNHGSSCKR